MFIQRNTHLNVLCGWYNFELNNEILLLLDEHSDDKSGMKFGKFLTKKGFSPKEIEDISNIVACKTVKISGSKNDFDRLAKSRHYQSCFGDFKSQQIEKFYHDPDIAICYVPDRSGSYLYRFLLRLVRVDGEYGLVAYKPYGNGNQQFIVDNLKNILGIPIWFGSQYTYENENNRYVFSPTKYNDIKVVAPVWSDHPICFRNRKIGIMAKI